MKVFNKIFPLLIVTMFALSGAAIAKSNSELQQEAKQALNDLYAKQPEARALSELSESVLVFPRIVKAGFVIGGEFGDGVLYKSGEVAGYYRTTGLSYGLQAGAQAYGYALFFMGTTADDVLNNRGGWEIGVGPSITVIDQGVAGKLSTTTAKDGIYAYIFDQKGLMAGVGLQGSKITKLNDRQ